MIPVEQEAPRWLLVIVACAAVLGYVCVVLAERRQHRRSDDVTEQHETEQHAEHEPCDRDECVVTHARTVARGPVDLPPGIPSIIERLDRWTG